MGFGYICFNISFNDYDDYLQLWHNLISMGYFYVCQGREKNEDQLGFISIVKLPYNKNINFFGKDLQQIYLNSKNFN